MSYLSSS